MPNTDVGSQSNGPDAHACISDERASCNRHVLGILRGEDYCVRKKEGKRPHDVDVAVVLLGLAKEVKTGLREDDTRNWVEPVNGPGGWRDNLCC